MKDNSDDNWSVDVPVFNIDTGMEDWVGEGDAIDYRSFTLDYAARVSFDLNATDATKFTIWKFDSKTKKLKSLQATTLAKDKTNGNYTFITKNLLLESGTYYFSMESTNAKKGGDATYSVEKDKNFKLFDQGDNSDDDYNGAGVTAFDFEEGWEGWVGYGDAVDYKSLTLDYASSVTFDVSSSDAGKFTIWSVVNGKKKSVQASTLKLDKVSGQYKFTTKNQLLQAGTYYISVENTNAKKGGSGDYTVATGSKYVVFDQGDNTDDTYNGPGVTAFAESWEGWVGYGDAIDYKSLTLTCASSVAFDVSSTDAGKFSIWSLNNGKLKSVQASTLKLDKTSGKYKFTTKNQLLEKGTYYISVENTNAKKGGSGDYIVVKNAKYVVFDQGDNTDDIYNGAGVAEYDTANGWTGWVGYGDPIDFKSLTLTDAASVTFDVSSTDAGKFTIWTLNKGKLKSVQATTLKLDKASGKYKFTTKNQLLEKGEYYISVENTNAKKGGSGDYAVATGSKYVVFDKGDNSDDWGDMKTAGADGAVGEITEPIIAGAQILADWVGFGDKVDYRAFTLDSKATIAFDVQSSDAAKFTVYELQSKTSKGVVTYSLKSLQGVTLKAGAPATTKSVKLAAGTYYIAMESTNAAKGGNADYTVAVNADSTFESLPMGEGDNEGTEGADLAIVNADKEIGTLALAGGDVGRAHQNRRPFGAFWHLGRTGRRTDRDLRRMVRHASPRNRRRLGALERHPPLKKRLFFRHICIFRLPSWQFPCKLPRHCLPLYPHTTPGAL